MKGQFASLTMIAVLSVGISVSAQDREIAPDAAPAAVATPTKTLAPVTESMLRKPSDGDWLMFRRTYNDWGYSPLSSINRKNVSKLQLAWSRPLAPGMQEGTPIAYGGLLIMPEPRNVIRAYNAETGDLVWEYKRQLPADLQQYQTLIDANRNLAVYENMIIGASADDFIYALDINTGKLIWQTVTNDYKTLPGMQSSGPIIADGKVISGRACWPKAGPKACVILAHDPHTGKELWRTSTIALPGDPNDATWGDTPYEKRWHVGAWMPPSYDPKTNLVFIGTSVTAPAPKFLLSGSDKTYLYHNSTLALDASTGKIVWHYQHGVDEWDLDNTFERMLIDTVVAPNPSEVTWINPKLKSGETRKVVTGIPGKNGIIYTLDRATGEFLWARATTYQNVIKEVQGDGKVVVNSDSVPRAKGDKKFICPGTEGGKNWPAGSYSPATKLMYFSLQNACQEMTVTQDKQDSSVLYGFGAVKKPAPDEPNIGTVQAFNVVSGKRAWSFKQRVATASLVSTAGGVLFVGDHIGRFRALDDRSGKVLWEVNLGAPLSGYPISYAVGGKQYVAVSTGGSIVSGALNNLAPELRPGAGNTMFVFSLN